MKRHLGQECLYNYPC